MQNSNAIYKGEKIKKDESTINCKFNHWIVARQTIRTNPASLDENCCASNCCNRLPVISKSAVKREKPISNSAVSCIGAEKNSQSRGNPLWLPNYTRWSKWKGQPQGIALTEIRKYEIMLNSCKCFKLKCSIVYPNAVILWKKTSQSLILNHLPFPKTF